jgi:hypothetical protein
MTGTPCQILLGSLNQESEGRSMWHACGRGEEHKGLWWGKLTEGDHLEDLGVDGGIQ